MIPRKHRKKDIKGGKQLLFVFFFRGPAPKWVFKLFIALASALLGAFLSFPGMRLANMYLDSLFYCKETRIML